MFTFTPFFFFFLFSKSFSSIKTISVTFNDCITLEVTKNSGNIILKPSIKNKDIISSYPDTISVPISDMVLVFNKQFNSSTNELTDLSLNHEESKNIEYILNYLKEYSITKYKFIIKFIFNVSSALCLFTCLYFINSRRYEDLFIAGCFAVHAVVAVIYLKRPESTMFFIAEGLGKMYLSTVIVIILRGWNNLYFEEDKFSLDKIMGIIIKYWITGNSISLRLEDQSYSTLSIMLIVQVAVLLIIMVKSFIETSIALYNVMFNEEMNRKYDLINRRKIFTVYGLSNIIAVFSFLVWLIQDLRFNEEREDALRTVKCLIAYAVLEVMILFFLINQSMNQVDIRKIKLVIHSYNVNLCGLSTFGLSEKNKKIIQANHPKNLIVISNPCNNVSVGTIQ